MKAGAALLAIVCTATLSCSGGDGSQRLVEVKMEEFSIQAPASAPAGDTHIQVVNNGDIPHSFLLLRTRLDPSKLPVVEGEVDVDALETVKALPKQDSRDIISVQLELTPGRYVMLCNIAGHYQSGMRAPLRVD